MKYSIALVAMLLSIPLFGQKEYEIGVEITAASGSNLGGSVGGSLKFAIVEEETLAYGPSLRYQYLWSNNTFTGLNANASLFGGGGFLHYRFLEWFFVGSEIEVLSNPFPVINPDKRWSLTAFFGGGVHHNFDWVKLNVGLLYDIADALRDPLINNPSPLRTSYFIQRKNPQPGSGPNGAYLPIIYRIAFFFPIG
ncbi:MAG: hypothetical protein P8O07_05315 [Crocinitomicaceae bacterium]|nr:hypothetical protein [Crocinitomicaceae bacterium]